MPKRESEKKSARPRAACPGFSSIFDPYAGQKRIIPARPGVLITISAGELASVKNVDELAGQMAKRLAYLNPDPVVFGAHQDARFVQNQKYAGLISQITEGSPDDVKDEAIKKKNEMIADLAAMERLAAGGFNPWALYNYENRVYRWLADVFLASPSHSLGRYLVNAKKYDIYDWSRPIRLELQVYYMAHLQSVERGRNMRLDDTKFSPVMERIRLRMKLFTQPFFSGLVKQTTPLALGSGVVITDLFFSHSVHWALSALGQTSHQLQGLVGLTPTAHQISTHIVTLVHASQQLTHSILTSSYLGAELGRAALSAFYLQHEAALLAASGVISSGVIAHYGKFIVAAVRAASDAFTTYRPNNRLEIEGEVVSDSQAPSDDLVLGSISSQSLRGIEFGSKIGTFLARVRAGSLFLYDKLMYRPQPAGVIIDGTVDSGDNFSLAVVDNESLTIEKRRNRIYEFGQAGLALSRRLRHGTALRSVSAWNTLVRVSAATPNALVRGAQGTVKIGIRFGTGTLKLGAVAAIGVGMGAKFLIIDAPGKVANATLEGVAGLIQKMTDAYDVGVVRRASRASQNEVRDEFLGKGRERWERLFESNLTPHEIFDEMGAINSLRSHSYKPDQTPPYWDWGFRSSPTDAEVYKYLSKAFARWIEQAKTKGVTDAEVLEFITGFSSVYSHLPEEVKVSKDFIKNSLAFYSLLTASKNETIKQMLAMASERSNEFLFKVKVSHEVQLAEINRSIGESVRLILQADPYTLPRLIKKLYFGNEAAILKYLAAPRVSANDLNRFYSQLNNIYPKRTPMSVKENIYSAIDQLSWLERLKVHTLINDQIILKVGGKGSVKLLKSSYRAMPSLWLAEAKNIKELTALIEADHLEYQFNFYQGLLLELREQIMKRPELFASFSDVEMFCEKEFYWPTTNSQTKSSPLEAPLVELLAKKREQFGDSPAWKYDPRSSEKTQTFLKRRLMAVGEYPNSYEGLEKTWKLFSSRGVSTITDEILGVLLKMADPAQESALETYAVTEGRVFDQGLRDEFAIRQIKRSREYLTLMGSLHLSAHERMMSLEDLVRLAQRLMTDLGISYVNFLEQLSVDINSSAKEATFIHESKVSRFAESMGRGVGQVNDSRLKMLNQIIPYVKRWDESNQYDFLLYLRGTIEATSFIEEQFPAFGPERIRKIYQGLPLESAMAVINLYLAETLLARKDISEGYGKKLINYLVKSGTDVKTREYASLLLEGLLVGIERTKNKPFQRQVLSALIAMKPDENASVGETLKLILEQFPGVGPKIGQFLVATGLLSPDINKVLIKTQDGTLPPNRFDVYTDLQAIVGADRELGLQLDNLLGAGSLKYSLKGRENASHAELALQVFRENVQNNADLQIKVLNEMIKYLIEKGGPEWAFLQVIVDGATNAVAREKRFGRESAKTALARERLYANFSDENFTVAVPVQQLVNRRLLVSRYARGGSFFKLSAEDQQAVGQKILEMEARILFSEDSEVMWYDTDRHAGNYLIEVVMVNGQKHYNISPIDFGQLTFIRRDQRERVVEMFALSSLLGKMGSNEWLTRDVARLFDLDEAAIPKLRENLAAFFPVSLHADKSVVTSYFSLIAAVNNAIVGRQDLARHRDLETGKLSFAYTDFVRAIIQLNQYEERVKLPASVHSPQRLLESRVKDLVVKKLDGMELSTKQKLGIKLKNVQGRSASLLTGEEYQPITLKVTREEMDKFKLFASDEESSPKKSMTQGLKRACRSILDGLTPWRRAG